MRTRLLRLIVAALIGILSLPALAGAGGIIFKDGFVLKGRVKREGDTVFDPVSGQQIQVGKGFFMVDDGVRRIIFSFRQVQDVIDNEPGQAGADLVVLSRPFTPLYKAELRSIDELRELKALDDNWEREVHLLPQTGKAETVRQRLTLLTPYAAVIQARTFNWGAYYLTRELGFDKVRSLVYSHPDNREKDGRVDLQKRLRVARFFKQAGWYDESEHELDALLKDLPSKEKEINEARQGLQGLKAEQLLSDIERANKAGRHEWAKERLAKFPTQGADDKQLAQVRTLRAHYEAADAAMTAARRFLLALPGRLSANESRKVWEEAAAAILAELGIDSVGRLETFIKYAEQDERERKQDKTPSHSPAQLLSLAVSGWLLGNGAADAKPEVGLKLWRTRQFIREYQKTASDSTRRNMLAAYEKEGAVAFDEMAQIIGFLPPLAPEEKISEEIMEIETKSSPRRKGVPYLLQVPPEYTAGRPYPLLIVLGNADEKPQVMLERWREQARQNGYLLAAPEWNNGFGKSYGYTVEEQSVVYETLRDLQRRFNVDTDRVFLAGYGEGGAMAFDVGLSRPDLFAGVLPFAAAPRLFATKYAPNGLHLPFYVVAGTLQGNDTYKLLRRQFDTWVSHSHPVLWVDYRGRALEWFDAEVPFAFDWMSRKKRSSATPETTEFQIQRTTDWRFYWLSVDGISERSLNEGRVFNNYSVPAAVQGRLGEGNSIHIHARGVKQVTVSLGRGMVDFEKPVSIAVNVQPSLTNRKLTPSLTTLLEDFYQRGDRQRLVLVKVVLPLEAR
jgi:pimeloyl-ACP methyl ester carboxylesterase